MGEISISRFDTLKGGNTSRLNYIDRCRYWLPEARAGSLPTIIDGVILIAYRLYLKSQPDSESNCNEHQQTPSVRQQQLCQIPIQELSMSGLLLINHEW